MIPLTTLTERADASLTPANVAHARGFMLGTVAALLAYGMLAAIDRSPRAIDSFIMAGLSLVFYAWFDHRAKKLGLTGVSS